MSENHENEPFADLDAAARDREVTPHAPVSMETAGLLLMTAGMPWALRPEAIDALVSALDVGILASASTEAVEPKEVKTANQIAVLPVQGVITPSGGRDLFSLLFGGGGGLDVFRKNLQAAVEDDSVKEIVLDINSPGGTVGGVPETAAAIREAGKIKNITAVANVQAASAAYWLASAANEVVVTPSGQVGSIGVYNMHADKSKLLAASGLKLTIISAGRFKTEGNEFQALSSAAKQARQETVDSIYSMFIADVAAGRGTTAQAVRNGYGEGRTLLADAAVDEGLADRVASFEEVLAGLGVTDPEAVVEDDEQPADDEEATDDTDPAKAEDEPEEESDDVAMARAEAEAWLSV